MSLLLRDRATSRPGWGRSLQEPGALLIVRIAWQPLARLVRRRQPMVPVFVRMRRAENRGIGPGERHREHRSVLHQPVSFDQPRFFGAEAAPGNGGDAVFTMKAGGVDHERVAGPMRDRVA